MKILILSILLFSNAVSAETPWARDCVSFWGSAIPNEERTQENCPSGRSHWDPISTTTSTSTRSSGDIITSPTSLGTTTTPVRYANPQVVTSILMPSGNYVVVPNHATGGIKAVIQTSRTK